jgi:hypothetical protein
MRTTNTALIPFNIQEWRKSLGMDVVSASEAIGISPKAYYAHLTSGTVSKTLSLACAYVSTQMGVEMKGLENETIITGL